LFIELIGQVLSKQFNCKVNELPDILSQEGVLLSGIPTHLESFLFDQLGTSLKRRISIMIFNDAKSFASWQDLETENGSREKERIELSIISGLTFDINALLNFGFARVGRVSEAGEYSLYGDVMILWPHGWKSPLRISFFGEEVESISIVTTEGFKHIEDLQSI
jgi:hypothetical protein